MTSTKTIEQITDRHATIEFRSEEIKNPDAYDDDCDRQPALSIRIQRNEKSTEVFSPEEIQIAIRDVGLIPKNYAAEEPLSVARAVGYLEDIGRVIHKSPLFVNLLQTTEDDLDELLPRFEGTTLIWNIIMLGQHTLITKERRMEIV